ncbi:hypothetical protein [Desulfoluna spongiiphila]|uniref:Uncharacterized protein n=1 Tax=Desulfoluna spongiiphila TaxID=419481 RepID=A0A1G5CSM4_9BACT|nr:hypothetical protein [Desulfoluna spongiiphila]SCY05392.1 hypothetical protein SAMN05216233_103185 [Desulfoluna spongiiphila]VVS92385.1 consensus disorder prediction [Desulfoluna spongiiphila]
MGKKRKKQKPITGQVDLTRQMGRIPTAPPSKTFADKSKYRRREKHKRNWEPCGAGLCPFLCLAA